MSEEKHETHADVVAEMRNRTDLDGGDMVDNFSLDASFGEYGGYDPIPLIKAYADRAEAAHKRELESISMKPDPDWKTICAKCKDGDIEPEHCEYYGEPNGCNSPIYGEHPTVEKSSAVGDAAKLREALKSLMDNLRIHAMMPCEQITMNRAEVCAMIEDCLTALAAPSRNCDVGTAEEQAQRFKVFCEANKDPEAECLNCPMLGLTGGHCELAWAQMPYESEASNGE